MLPEMLVLIAVTLIIWTLGFLYFRNYLRRRTGSRRILAEFQEEVDKLIAQINTAGDQGLTLMEDRISSLKKLLEETDRRIAVYKKETDRRAMHDRAYAEMGKKTIVKTEEVVPSQPAESTDTDVQLSTEGPRFVRSSIRVEPKKPFAEQVFHLAKAGFSVELIAKNLGTSIAEVELAIALAERNKEN